MKRIVISLGLIFCMALPALARSDDAEDVLRCIQSAYPGCMVKQMDVCGSAAAAVLEHELDKVLCILERQEGKWAMAVGSDTVLLPDEPLPQSILLNADQTLFWTYSGLNDAQFVFRAARAVDGLWYFCDECMYNTYYEGNKETRLTWSGNEGTLRYQVSWYDANETLLWHETEGFLPASWLKGNMDLRVFDIADFPALMEVEYDGQWPERDYLTAAAEQLLPAYVYRGGSMVSGTLRFLVDRPDGTRVLAIYNLLTGQMTQSAPLPNDTYYGVENFTDSLGLNGLCVSVGEYGTHGVSHLMGYGEEGAEIQLGPMVVEGCGIYEDNVMVYGDHPWSDVRTIDWSSLPTTVEEAFAGADAQGYALVNNADTQGRLNLREAPDRGSHSLGKYYTGTPVRVHAVNGDWVDVTVGGSGWTRRGWMMKAYLDFSAPLVIESGRLPHVTPIVGAKLYALPRKGVESRTVTKVATWYVMGLIEEDWCHIWNPWTDDTGYMRIEDVSPGNG